MKHSSDPLDRHGKKQQHIYQNFLQIFANSDKFRILGNTDATNFVVKNINDPQHRFCIEG